MESVTAAISGTALNTWMLSVAVRLQCACAQTRYEGSEQISPTQGDALETRVWAGIGLTVVLGLFWFAVDRAEARPVTVTV